MKLVAAILMLFSLSTFAKGVECKLLNSKGKIISKCQYGTFFAKRNNSYININDCTLTGTQKERGDIRVHGKITYTEESEETVITFSVEAKDQPPVNTSLQSDEYGRYIDNFSNFPVDTEYKVACATYWEPKKLRK